MRGHRQTDLVEIRTPFIQGEFVFLRCPAGGAVPGYDGESCLIEKQLFVKGMLAIHVNLAPKRQQLRQGDSQVLIQPFDTRQFADELWRDACRAQRGERFVEFRDRPAQLSRKADEPVQLEQNGIVLII